MWKFNLSDAAGRILESCLTSFGKVLCVTTYQKEQSLWQSVSWADAVSETALVTPDAEGSIEICDILIAAEKKAGGSLTIHFDDSPSPGGNTKTVVSTTVADGLINLAVNFSGKVQGWRGAVLYYTVVGTYIGSVLVTFVKHDKDNSKTYAEMALESGW